MRTTDTLAKPKGIKMPKGKKQCPCGEFVAPRCKVCTECGHEFAFKKVDYTPDPPREQSVSPNVGPKIFTPVGNCPEILLDTDEESVRIWAYKVVLSGAKNGVCHTQESVLYYLRGFHAPYTEEYKKGRSVVLEVFDD